MGKVTETPRGERLVKIFGHLVRNKARKFSVQDILTFLSQDENVTLRNVQRDLKALTEIRGIPVRCETIAGKKQYPLSRTCAASSHAHKEKQPARIFPA